MNTQFVQGEPLFARVNKVPKQYEYLTKDLETDVIIVGGGVTGSILGYYFTKNNIKSVILEKNIVGFGSTSLTTALLQYELDSFAKDLEQYLSMENIIKAYKLGLKALDEIDEFIQENGNKCGYERKDTLTYTGKERDIKEIEEEFNIRKKYGFDVEFISEETNSYSFDLKAAIYVKNGGAQLDPYKYTHELLEVSVKKGLQVYENTEVVKVNYGEDYVEALTRYGFKVKGKIIIVATGYNTGLFSKRSFGTTGTTFNIASQPLGDTIEGYPGKPLIRDNKVPYNYFRTTEDNRIIGGGQDVNFLPEIYNEKLAEEKYSIIESNIKNMFNKVKDINIEYKYCGAFTSTQDNLGFIGKDPDNKKLWYNLGYGANGILFAILGGLMLSKLYVGESPEDLELFRIDRFDN